METWIKMTVTKKENKFSDLFPCFHYSSQALQGHTDTLKMHFNPESFLFLEDSSLKLDAEFWYQCICIYFILVVISSMICLVVKDQTWTWRTLSQHHKKPCSKSTISSWATDITISCFTRVVQVKNHVCIWHMFLWWVLILFNNWFIKCNSKVLAKYSNFVSMLFILFWWQEGMTTL